MHIKIIGSNMKIFYDEFKKASSLKNIINYWDIEQVQTLNNDNIIKYFNYLKSILDNDITKNLREVLILKFNNLFDPEVNIFLDKMNQLYKNNYMILVLLLIVNNSKKKLIINTNKYEYIDPR